MARRRKQGRSRGLTIDGTELKMAAQLFSSYKGPESVGKALNKDLTGALKEYGSGTILDTGIKSLGAGFIAKSRRRFGMYVRPITSRFFRFRM